MHPWISLVWFSSSQKITEYSLGWNFKEAWTQDLYTCPDTKGKVSWSVLIISCSLQKNEKWTEKIINKLSQ